MAFSPRFTVTLPVARSRLAPVRRAAIRVAALSGGNGNGGNGSRGGGNGGRGGRGGNGDSDEPKFGLGHAIIFCGFAYSLVGEPAYAGLVSRSGAGSPAISNPAMGTGGFNSFTTRPGNAGTAFGTNLGISSAAGYYAAITFKKYGQTVAFVAGLAFVAFQLASFYGLIPESMNHMQQRVVSHLDVSGTGNVDADAQIYLTKLQSLAAQGGPASAGFVTGFVSGLQAKV